MFQLNPELRLFWVTSGRNPVTSFVQICISLKQAHRFYSSLLPSAARPHWQHMSATMCVCVCVCWGYREGGSHPGFASSIVVRLSPVRALWALGEPELQKQPFRPFSRPAPLLYSHGKPGKGFSLCLKQTLKKCCSANVPASKPEIFN